MHYRLDLILFLLICIEAIDNYARVLYLRKIELFLSDKLYRNSYILDLL